VADDRVVDVISGAPEDDGDGGGAGSDPDHVGQEDGKVSADDGGGQAEAGVAETVDQLGASFKPVLHTGSLFSVECELLEYE
jgi:hypothetical protein